MNYYIGKDSSILATITFLSPDPPLLNEPVIYCPNSIISGDEICIVSENGALYFVLQQGFTLHNAAKCMSGIVTEVGRASDLKQLQLSINEYNKPKNNTDSPNQSIEAIVKTPIDKVEPQGTQPHA